MKSKMRRYNWYIVLTKEQSESLKSGIESYFRLNGIKAGYDMATPCFYLDIPRGDEEHLDKYNVYITGFLNALT